MTSASIQPLASTLAHFESAFNMREHDDLRNELRRAQRACRIACVCMYIIVAFFLLIAFIFIYTMTQTDSLDFLTNGQRLGLLIDIGAGTIWVILMAEFLRHFAKGNPFGKAQSLRLFLAGTALAIRTLFDGMIPGTLFDASVPELGTTVSSQADIDLKVVAMIVFLIALSLIVRYGDALKQDSDSIL